MSILDKIIDQKKIEVGMLKGKSFNPSSKPKRPFAESLSKSERLSVIAEIKKASPSKGIICNDFEPVKIAKNYESGGASALSVLTDERFFGGSVKYISDVRKTVSIPVLRKEFIIDIIQVEQSASIGADALLLIAAALDKIQLKDLFQASKDLDIDPLIEVHSAMELDKVMALEPALIGINNRDLNTFKTDIKTTLDLIGIIPDEVTVVSESGIFSGEQASSLKKAGVDAILVGESLMRNPDPSSLIKELSCICEDPAI
ncbi:MAG: indole-3-glycerol phosphate synthase TrpC [Fibrobacter sp.]|nr:indole-3-glycerol phosphate synthase TrpC [Fibrobacter sp.]